MRALVFRNFLPLNFAFGVLFEILHCDIEMVSAHTGSCFCLVLDVFDAFKHYLLCSLEIIMPKTVLVTQDVADSSFTVEVVWRKMMFFHTMKVYTHAG